MRGGIARLVVAALLATGLTAGESPISTATTSPPVAVLLAEPRDVRLEPGPQMGYRFSAAGVVVAHREARVKNAPLMEMADSRRVVPNQPGFYLRLTTGSIAGYEVRESPVAYLTGRAGRVILAPDATVALRAGRYLGYRFDDGWGLGTTRYAVVSRPTSLPAGVRAVVNGRAYVRITDGDWSSWWLPLSRPRARSAEPIGCDVPAKPEAGSSQVLSRVETDEPKLALTFDLGGRLDPALQIVSRLVIDRVCATVHPTGATALTSSGSAVMALVAAHPELFEVGNHTMHNCNLVAGGDGPSCPATPPTTRQIQAELTQAQTVIRDLTGLEAAPYWRPPFGAYDAHARSAAAAIGYTKTLMWDVDTIDWKRTVDGGPSAASMQDKVVTGASKGSIVLMHLGGYHTYDALPGMVLRLRADGLSPTTISDLLD